MIIDKKRKYLFIHIPKCAGESVSKFLFKNEGINFLGKHDKLKNAINQLSDSYHQYYTFSVVRNPFDQVVSFYEHLRKPLYIDHKQLRQQYPNFDGLLFPKEACKLAINLDFKNYVKAVYLNQKNDDLFSFWFDDQVSFLSNDQGAIDVKYIIRFEKISEGISFIREEYLLSRGRCS